MHQNSGTKQRILGYDFARAVCMSGIFLYHALTVLGAESSAPGVLNELGFVFVAAFLALSGAVLMERYASFESGTDVLRFYQKRAGSIFPLFYVVYLLLFGWNLVRRPMQILADLKDHGWTLIFTVAGLDGYLSQALPTWYLVGEWFLGALVLLYLLYPLLCQIYRKSPLLLLVLSLAGYALAFSCRLLSPDPITNLCSVLVCFVWGMFFSGAHLAHRRSLAPWALAALAILLLLPVTRINENIHAHLLGMAVFAFLTGMGEWVMRFSRPQKGFGFLGRISYPFFLLHHVLLSKGLSYLPDGASTWQKVVAVLFFYGVTMLLSWLLQWGYETVRSAQALRKGV